MVRDESPWKVDGYMTTPEIRGHKLGSHNLLLQRLIKKVTNEPKNQIIDLTSLSYLSPLTARKYISPNPDSIL